MPQNSGKIALTLLALTLLAPGCTPQPQDFANHNDNESPPDNGNSNTNDNESSPPTGDPFEDYVLDPDIYAAEPDADHVIEATGDDGTTLRFPVDQLILLMVEDSPREEAERLAEEVGGAIVGQVPDLDFYQIELAATTREELDAALEHVRAGAGVEQAGYNLENVFEQECPAESDLETLEDNERCAFAHTEYYQALTQFDAYREYLTLHTVTIGVLDSGVQASNGEFDDATLLNVDHPGDTLIDGYADEGHGTQVTGIIAADNDEAGVNGIASRFLGEDLRVAVGTGRYVASTLASGRRAIQAGARVLNLSFGYPLAQIGETYARDSFERFFRSHADVLFVVAAGNDGAELTSFSAPAGIDLPNVVTVGAAAECDPQTLASFSNYGQRLTLNAPGESVTVTGRYNGHETAVVSGTSYAAPQVTALAAILLALDSELSVEELVETYLLQHALPMEDGSGIRMVFAAPIGQLILDLSPGSPVEDYLDPEGLGNYGSTGIVMSRICRGLSYTVEGYGTHEISGTDSGVAAGIIAADEFTITGSTDETLFLVDAPSPFALGTYDVVRDATAGSATVQFTDTSAPAGGEGTSGEFTVESCRIDERNPLTNDPLIISAAGTFDGLMEISLVDPPVISSHAFEGYFNLTFTVANVQTGDPLLQYLEESCEGGTAGP